MGTSNFHNTGTSEIYVVDYGEDEFMWQECQEHLADQFKETLKNIQKGNYIDFTTDDDITSQEELRSFPTSSIGYFEVQEEYLGVEIYIRVNTFIRSGYYEAANLDYEIEVSIDGEEYEDYTEYDDEAFMWSGDRHIGTWSLHSSRFYSKIETMLEEVVETTEKVFCKCSEAYEVSAQFSNGETHYSKCECVA